MNRPTKRIIPVLIIIIALFVIFRNRDRTAVVTPEPTETASVPMTSRYVCNAGKTIDVLQGKDGIQVTLSDGRSFALPHAISADGARYANKDESFVFWNKGNGALVLENNQQKNYIGCVITAKDPGGLPQVFATSTFSIRLPEGYTVDSHFSNTITPKMTIHGVKFTIPKTLAAGTNLSSDSYISYESIPAQKVCTAGMFLDGDHPAAPVTQGDITYSVASSSNAGAGNRYEETVYALPWTNPCIAIRYMIHYSVFENYPAGSVKKFDQAALLAQFDAIRKTLVINP